MKSYQLIQQLLDLVEKFESENSNREGTLHDFTGFLVTGIQVNTEVTGSLDVRFGKNEYKAQELAYQIDNNIARLVIYMSRYAKSYIKKALDNTPLHSPEEFTGLAILLTHDNLSKSELISRNLQEKTSGTEVIKRLLASGLVEQWDDDQDKRGKRISITNEGKELLYQVFVQMGHVSKIVTGKLTTIEKITLQHLLQKLEDFHYQVFESKIVNTKGDLALLAETLPS